MGSLGEHPGEPFFFSPYSNGRFKAIWVQPTLFSPFRGSFQAVLADSGLDLID